VLVSTLEQTHPDRNAKAIREHRALYEGGDAWRELLETWLPRNANEPADLYEDRKSRALYLNHAGGIVGLLSAYLFSEPPSVEGLEGDYWTDLDKDVDQGGTPLTRFWRQRFVDALVDRRAWVWVNAPAKPEGLVLESRLDEERSGMDRLYLVSLTESEVLDWELDAHGRIVWAIVRQTYTERLGVDAKRIPIWRWTEITATTLRRWEWRGDGGDKHRPDLQDNASELPTIAHGMGAVPLVRLELPKGLWAMHLLRDPAVAHLRARNGLSWALHRSAHAMMWLRRKFADQDPTLGQGYYLNLEEGEEAGWLEPPSGSYQVLRDDVQDLKEELFRVVHQMATAADSDATATRMSGLSKEQDWKAADVVMSAYADLVRSAVAECLTLIANARREDAAELSVSGLEGWQHETLETFLASAALAVDASRMSPTFRKVVARRQAERLLGDEVSSDELEVIRAEIDAHEEPAEWVDPTRPPPAKGSEDEGDDDEDETPDEDPAE
jgi:hypothetical protein